MIPIYEAIEVVEIIDQKIGHNKPWVVRAITPSGVENFYVKLYNYEQVQNNYIITREIISSLLSRQFELQTPDFALIEIPESITLSLPAEAHQQFAQADHRLKFATIELKGVHSIIKGLKPKYLRNQISTDTLYAFDNFVRNNDRGTPKINLLSNGKKIYLIDHEYALSPRHIGSFNICTDILENSFTRSHIFYSLLSNASSTRKYTFFEEFSFLFTELSINSLNPYFSELSLHGYPDYSSDILRWFDQIQQNFSIFVNKLRESLQ